MDVRRDIRLDPQLLAQLDPSADPARLSTAEAAADRRRARRGRIGIGLAALTVFGLSIPATGGAPDEPVRPATPPAPASGLTADGGCATVDENGVPLHDSQYAQRTGHAPC